jgi:hypothetical protein
MAPIGSVWIKQRTVRLMPQRTPKDCIETFKTLKVSAKNSDLYKYTTNWSGGQIYQMKQEQLHWKANDCWNYGEVVYDCSAWCE